MNLITWVGDKLVDVLLREIEVLRPVSIQILNTYFTFAECEAIKFVR